MPLRPIFTLLLLSFCINAGFAQETPSKWRIKPSVGFQHTNFDWSIAGNSSGANPNILSEVIWQDLKGMQYGLDIEYEFMPKLGLKAIAQYSNVGKGMVTDTDYADDNRQRPFYEDRLNANKGNVFSLGLQANYEIWHFENLSLNPILGISYLHQRFYLLESETNPNSSGLNSTYTISNKGWDFGAAVGYHRKIFSLSATILGGFYTYAATASWNLIPSFVQPVSFTQDANSFRLQAIFNLSIPVTDKMRVELDYRVNQLNTQKGVDRTFYTNAPGEETQFNGASLKNNSLQLGLNFCF